MDFAGRLAENAPELSDRASWRSPPRPILNLILGAAFLAWAAHSSIGLW